MDRIWKIGPASADRKVSHYSRCSDLIFLLHVNELDLIKVSVHELH